MQAISLKCPNCGDSLTTEMKKCPSCKQPVIFSNVSAVSEFSPLQLNKYISSYKKTVEFSPENKAVHASLATCYLKLKMYDKALLSFEKAIEDNFDDSCLYLYASICVLGGKKPFLLDRKKIDKAIEYINSAIMIEPKGIYFYVLAYIKYDYFKRKFFSTTPSFEQTFATALAQGVTKEEVNEIFELASVTIPAELAIS